ncbi:guanylyl cyclase-activating protein 1-like [Solea senegalensis]|uniref:Guanylyl cyclase-activating protein 1-like n=1 Tax=Solea senegalensis TaxID=28829 RepID=A0AAV6SDJ9_SOLSE|nr:guanylyl cyclase-activating protein 1-like [Solea senegalensis]
MGNHGSNLEDILAEDMHHWYNKFMRESPSGLITLFELKAILGLKGMNENANSYVDQVFFTFDMDGDGYIDFVEYIAAISLLLKGEINQKLKWYFKLFDQDGNGKIDRDELETIFSVTHTHTRIISVSYILMFLFQERNQDAAIYFSPENLPLQVTSGSKPINLYQITGAQNLVPAPEPVPCSDPQTADLRRSDAESAELELLEEKSGRD